MCDSEQDIWRLENDPTVLSQMVHLLQDRSQNKSHPLSNLRSYGKTVLFLFHNISQVLLHLPFMYILHLF